MDKNSIDFWNTLIQSHGPQKINSSVDLKFLQREARDSRKNLRFVDDDHVILEDLMSAKPVKTVKSLYKSEEKEDEEEDVEEDWDEDQEDQEEATQELPLKANKEKKVPIPEDILSPEEEEVAKRYFNRLLHCRKLYFSKVLDGSKCRDIEEFKRKYAKAFDVYFKEKGYVVTWTRAGFGIKRLEKDLKTTEIEEKFGALFSQVHTDLYQIQHNLTLKICDFVLEYISSINELSEVDRWYSLSQKIQNILFKKQAELRN